MNPELDELTDEELLELRDALYGFAQLGFEAYVSEKYGSKYPVWLFPINEDRSRI